MGIHAYNSEALGINRFIHFDIYNEFVGGLLVPEAHFDVDLNRIPFTAVNQWRLIWLVATWPDADRPWLATGVDYALTDLHTVPDAPYKRRIGAWASLPDALAPHRAIQHNDRVVYSRDIAVDPAFSEPPQSETSGRSTHGVWRIRAAYSHFPPRHAAAVLLRMEAKANLEWRSANGETAWGSTGLCFVQANAVGSNTIREFTDDDGNPGWRAQTKGTVRGVHEDTAYDDLCEVWLPPGPFDHQFGVFCQPQTKMSIWASGFILKPT
jgi:hypothetical protein